jgi:hypothetical protein
MMVCALAVVMHQALKGHDLVVAAVVADSHDPQVVGIVGYLLVLVYPRLFPSTAIVELVLASIWKPQLGHFSIANLAASVVFADLMVE